MLFHEERELEKNYAGAGYGSLPIPSPSRGCSFQTGISPLTTCARGFVFVAWRGYCTGSLDTAFDGYSS